MDDPRSERLYYLDWLRFLVVLSLAPFHAALSFTGMGAVFVYDTPVRDAILAGHVPEAGPAALRLFTVFFDNWFMHLLFLVSGVGAAYSLRKRGARAFVGERANRLLIPLLLGTLLVVSVQSWLRALSFGTFSGGFLSFYPHFFNGIHGSVTSPGNYDWGHLWFLAYLFVFSVLALPLFLRMEGAGPASRHPSAASRLSEGASILAPALWIAVLEALFRPGWPGYQNLVADWANFTVYLSFFVFGYLAGKEPGLLEAVERARWAALGLGLAAFAARLGTYRLFRVGPGYDPANVAAQALRGLAAYGLVLAFVGFGRRRLNRAGPGFGWARDLSFPLYVLHFAPLCAAIYLLDGSGLSVWTRWAIAVAASWGFVGLFTVISRYVPPLRDFFGIRKPAARGDRGRAAAMAAAVSGTPPDREGKSSRR